MMRQKRSSNVKNRISSSVEPRNEKRREVTPDDIEVFARSILVALGMWRLPVDPFAIVRQEGIELAPGEYGPKFDARIKFIPSEKAFMLFYRESKYGPTEGRVRFSIGHELGHFYLPHHRAYLLSGKSHNSVSDF